MTHHTPQPSRFQRRQQDFAAAQSIVYVEIVNGAVYVQDQQQVAGHARIVDDFARPPCRQHAVITFTTEQWSAWLVEVTTDRLTNTNGAVTVIVAPEAWTVRSLDAGHALVFDDKEWTAFRLGATDGEFDPSRALASAST